MANMANTVCPPDHCLSQRSMSPQSWHEHPLLLLYHKTKSGSDYYCYCEDELSGPTYMCSERHCEFLLHERCSSIQSTMTHPHHPDHQVTLRGEADDKLPLCRACCKTIVGFHFSFESCPFLLHSRCAARLPFRKQYLHEHELLYLDEAWSWECNRCSTVTDSSFLHCVRCNFNLHEKCMEVPRVVESEVHWHPLTLHESYVEDDTGEYYCDGYEKRRDSRLGVYMCLQCPQRWTYHINCILSKLQKVYEKKSLTPVIERLNERIVRKHEEVHATEVELEEVKRELDELEKERDELVSREEHYEDTIDSFI